MNDHPAPRPELLAPAGDWECLRAAVANGADAVYFGLSNFNARHRAANFTLDELPEVIGYLHQRNVKGYVAFNTLIFSDELPDAVRFLSAIAAAGTDAVIVQDLGVAALCHRLAPGLPIHASTQMTLTEPRGIDFVRSLGVERAILARELSVEQIERIAGATDMPLEVFVHGALCVAYSGQCLTSEALGGRSANRGQCAQACRLPYEMLVDGQPRDLGDRAYLLSPQDLAAHDLIDRLTRAGVGCFKIEGRLKSAQYVAITTQTYRAALDAALAARPFTLGRAERLDLEQSFSRGFTPGFLEGVNHQELVQGRFPKTRGVRIGTVTGKTARGVLVELAAGHMADVLKPGDGIVFDEGHPEQDEQGGRIVSVTPAPLAPWGRGVGGEGSRPAHQPQRPRPDTDQTTSRDPSPPAPSPSVLHQGERGAGTVELVLAHGAVNLAAVAEASIVWRTDDPTFRKRMERSYARDCPARRVPLTADVSGRCGGPLRLTLRDPAGAEANAEWAGPLELARNHPTTVEMVREQLARLGDTPFELGALRADLPEPLLLPKSVLNDLRRQAVALLLAQRQARQTHAVAEPAVLEHLRAAINGAGESAAESRLIVLVRTPEQLAAVLAWRPAAPLPRPALVWCEFEDLRRYRDAVPQARAAGLRIGLTPPRVLKPGEEGFLRQVVGYQPDALLVRNLASLTLIAEGAPEIERVGDFALNVANEITADLLLRQGLARLVPSYDLNWEQLAAILGRIDPGVFEVVVHQHMPMFHMEHCVFAAFMSTGKDWRDCGRPCDHHRVELRDRVGAEFPVLADAGCRNTVFNSVPQSAAEFLPRMQALGLRHFRVELLRERAAEVGPLLEGYTRVLSGLDDGRGAWRHMQTLNQLGVTRGTLRVGLEMVGK